MASVSPRKQDVLGLEIAVQDAFPVRGLDRAADARQDPGRSDRVEAAFAHQHPSEVLASHQLHHQEGAAVRQRAVVEDRHDRWVLQPRHDLRLAAEPAPCLEVAEQLGADHLDGDEPIEPHVPRAIDGSHSAAAQQLLETVLACPPPAESRAPASSSSRPTGRS